MEKHWNPDDRSPLIFDVGMCNGDDSAYYLRLGHRVVGVEANPLLCASCERRFAAEIRQGRMIIINGGILEDGGEFTFYQNLSDPGWSSFEREKGTRGGKWEEHHILCSTTRDIIERVGTPFFMKVDIEGKDIQTLKSLTPELAPAYVSLELNCDDPVVESLIGLSYSAFKFVDGSTYHAAAPIFDHEIGWRLLRKAGRLVPPVRAAIARLPQKLRAKDEYNPPGKYSPDGYKFTDYSSGPFGEHAAGRWLDAASALRWLEELKRHYRRAKLEDQFWWDVHARHSSAEANL